MNHNHKLIGYLEKAREQLIAAAREPITNQHNPEELNRAQSTIQRIRALANQLERKITETR